MRRIKIVFALVVAVLALQVGLGVSLVSADPHVPGQSVNVAIIGSPGVMNGGTFDTSGGGFAAFTFTNLAPANVNLANLANYDTVLLNVASWQMGCNVNTLTAQAKADLVTWTGQGHKLIIYDSECSPQNYSWLPYPFTTANPGAMGATGTLNILEENLLSSNIPGDLHYIDAVYLGTGTDAIGDMNVMTTYNPNWCVDMSGTNYLRVTGPVHTYAKYPSGTDQGLIIYNGMDVDMMPDGFGDNQPWGPNDGLSEVWLQELQEPFNPSNLPCGYTVVGITLNPPTATNTVGQNHTVTAKLADLLGNPKPGILVTFSVVSGPNTATGGTCTVNADCTTAANGEVSFTYVGDGGVGIDTIKACFTDPGSGQVICSQEVTKEWVPPVFRLGIPAVGQFMLGATACVVVVSLAWATRRRRAAI